MSKLLWWLIVILILGLIVSVSIVIVETKTDYGCLHIFSPSQSQIARRVNISLPQSTSNLEWRCLSGILDGDEIYIKFAMVSNDLASFTASNPTYYAWNFIEPTFFFNLFRNPSNQENELVHYSTFQSNSTCGWTNLLIDMDNPDIYVVYADYHDWEDCNNSHRLIIKRIIA